MTFRIDGVVRRIRIHRYSKLIQEQCSSAVLSSSSTLIKKGECVRESCDV